MMASEEREASLHEEIVQLREELHEQAQARLRVEEENERLRARLRELETLFLPGWPSDSPPSRM
jgi:hypothetical protein